MCASYSVLKGLKSLSARLAYHHESALKIASYLSTVKGVVKILCPALPKFPYYYLWKRDYTLANGVLSFVLECPDQTMRLRLARRCLDALKIFGLDWSWGGCKSLAAPVKLSHRWHAPEFVGPVIRLQVGLESVDGLVWDLEKGFKAL
ncbi:PLP-dependent transferase [Candidatus Hodgkinia cicadicola]